MIEKERLGSGWIVGNPLYVLSAAALMYGVAQLLNSGDRTAGDISQILSTYGVIQLYEIALLAMAAWVLLRLIVPEDGVTLLVIEGLILGGAFITLDELLAADTGLGLWVAGSGLMIALVKMTVVRRTIGVPLGPASHLAALALLALPIVWVPVMKGVVDRPTVAAWMAYASWSSLAGTLLVLIAMARWRVFGNLRGPAVVPLAVLGATMLLAAGGHLYSLHHSFLAPLCAWYAAPALIVLAAGIALVSLRNPRSPVTQRFAALCLPFVPLVFFALDTSWRRGPWRELPEMLQPFACAQWWVVMVLLILALLTRRLMPLVPLAAGAVLAVGPRRQVAFDLAWDHRSWCFVLAAFALLALGGWLSAHKHHYRIALGATLGEAGAPETTEPSGA